MKHRLKWLVVVGCMALSGMNTLGMTKAGGDLYINEAKITLTKDTGYIMSDNGRTYVPLKMISDAAHIKTSYDKAKKAVFIRENGLSVDLFVDDYMAVINGEWVPIDSRDGDIVKETTVKVVEGRTYVPVRFISEVLGIDISYNKGDIHIKTRGLDALPYGEVVHLKNYYDLSNVGELSRRFLQSVLAEHDQGDISQLKVVRHKDLSHPIELVGGIKLYSLDVDSELISLEVSEKVEVVNALLFDENKELRHLHKIYRSEHDTKELNNGNHMYVGGRGPESIKPKYVGIIIGGNGLTGIGIEGDSTLHLIDTN